MINNNETTGRITTSKGNQLKYQDGQFWYKADNLGYEGAAEFITSRILEHSNVDEFVRYEMCFVENSGKKNGCRSENFLNDGDEIITADRMFKYMVSAEFPSNIKRMNLSDSIQYFVDNVVKITDINEFGQLLTKMLEVDQLILNDDRHFNNIAFIRNNNGKYTMTPLFDNGGAFMSDTMSYPLENSVYGLIPKVTAKPFNSDFDSQVDACHKLYGKQLMIDNEDCISDSDWEDVQTKYGEKITTRIKSIWENQSYIYTEYFR